jgi:putative DNA methylase
MSYGFRNWRDFFNDRQLLALGMLHAAIQGIERPNARLALATLFSGVLEFNNLFASYKGEGTGAVRHMFSHHILKPERTPIEANVWGTPKSSGSFSNLFRGRLLRAMDYREFPTELNGKTGPRRVCSLPFTGKLSAWPENECVGDRAICLSCGDSADTRLPSNSVDLVVTDPPFFDNVHYSELADFFYAWQQLPAGGQPHAELSTRHEREVQDADPAEFSAKLQRVFRESCRVLKDDGMLVFSYHHSREEGWQALAEAILTAGFTVVNAQPVKAEMAVATPKSQAKEPIQLDIIVVCRKTESVAARIAPSIDASLERARSKIRRLQAEGFNLSRNDQKIILYGQLLPSIKSAADLPPLAGIVTEELSRPCIALPKREPQRLLFEEYRANRWANWNSTQSLAKIRGGLIVSWLTAGNANPTCLCGRPWVHGARALRHAARR